MKSKYRKKLIKLVNGNQYFKLKSYIKKYDLDINDFLEEKSGNTLLHLSCKFGCDAIVSYLLKKGADCLRKNLKGDLPIHLACKFAASNKHAYTDIILPMMKQCPSCVDIPNARGITARDLLEEIKRKLQNQYQTSDSSSESDEENSWDEKISGEMYDEYSQTFGAYDDDYLFEGRVPDTYDTWADSMREQYRRKFHSSASHKHSSQKRPIQGEANDHGKRPRISDERKEEFARKLQEEYKKRKANESSMKSMKARKDYAAKCRLVFGAKDTERQLFYSDIPWPHKEGGTVEDVADFLFADLDQQSKTYKRYLREQQIQWHPDRFLQKCGSRLVERDKERITDKVKGISQVLNGLSEGCS